MEIIKSFGIDPILLAAQVVNFLIIFWLLKKFAYKPIFKVLSDRKKAIAETVKNAEETKKALEKAVEEEKKILKNAQTQAQQILSDAKASSDQIMEESRTTAKEQVEKMMAEAHAKMQQETKQMEKDLAVRTAAMAVELLRESIQDVFTVTEQKEAVEKLTKKLKSR